MSKLLIVEDDITLCDIFKKLLANENGFEVDIVHTYHEARKKLNNTRYEFSVVNRVVSDAGDGKIIALLNKYNVAPIVYTKDIDEDFVESFESARIVEYILRHRYDNVEHVVSRLKQLKENKHKIILIVHESDIYRRYLKQNLLLHNFKVISVASASEALQKLAVNQDIRLMIVNKQLKQLGGVSGFDGLELLKRVRKLKKDELNIIALASESNSYETSLFLNEGADDYLINQYSRDELYVRIYQNLRNSY